MATAASAKPKSAALDAILKKFDDLIEEQAGKLSPEEFEEAEKRANAVYESVKRRASRHGKRERA